MSRRELRQFSTESRQPLIRDDYYGSKKDDEGCAPDCVRDCMCPTTRCCLCCCECDCWYCETKGRCLNCATCIIVYILIFVTIAVGIVFYPHTKYIDFELLPGEQVVYRVPSVFERNRMAAFVSRGFDCNVSVTSFAGDLNEKSKRKLNTSFTIDPVWVSAGEHVVRSFFFTPETHVEWSVNASYPSTSNIPVNSSQLGDDFLPHYALFKSRKSYEKYSDREHPKATDKTAEVIGSIKTGTNSNNVGDNKLQYDVKSDGFDEYFFVLEARNSSVTLSAKITARRIVYQSSAQTSAKSVSINETYRLETNSLLVENTCEGDEQTSKLTKAVTLGIFFETEEPVYALIFFSVIVGIFFIHIILIIVFCCCACHEHNEEVNRKPDIFKRTYSPSSYSFDNEKY